MAPEDICKTAIITLFGMFELLSLPFGLRKAGNIFQKLMDSILKELPCCFTYVNQGGGGHYLFFPSHDLSLFPFLSIWHSLLKKISKNLFCWFIFLWFLTSVLMVIILLELTRVNLNRNIFSINIYFFSLYRKYLNYPIRLDMVVVRISLHFFPAIYSFLRINMYFTNYRMVLYYAILRKYALIMWNWTFIHIRN